MIEYAPNVWDNSILSIELLFIEHNKNNVDALELAISRTNWIFFVLYIIIYNGASSNKFYEQDIFFAHSHNNSLTVY